MTQPGTLPVLPSPRFPKKQLLDIIRTASGVPTTWWTAKQPHPGPQQSTERAWITVGLQSIVNVDIDEGRAKYIAETNALSTVHIGHRMFTTPLTANSLDPSLEAYDLLERIRFRLRSAQIQALFAGTLALVDIKAINVLPDSWADSVNILRANLDVRWRAVLVADDLGADEGGFIEGWTDNPGGIGTLIP